MKKYSNITLKRGTFKSSKNQFFDEWKKTVFFQEDGEQYRGDMTISMLDEAHEPVVTWSASNAWLLKIQSTDLKADGMKLPWKPLSSYMKS